MSNIRIVVKDIELDYVSKDLTMLDENNSFYERFKVPHNTYPIRLIENEKTFLALGSISMVSANKRKKIPCKLFIGIAAFDAQIIQLSLLPGFRKCNIRIGSKLLTIKDKKISDFFPDYNVMGHNPKDVPYSEKSDTLLSAYPAWNWESKYRATKIFPEIQWQMAVISYKELFWTGEPNLKHPFIQYKEEINGRDAENNLLVNYYEQTTDYVIASNYNVVSPQVFLLAPLYNIFNHIGYRLTGTFVSDPIMNRILMYSKNNNNTTVLVNKATENIYLDPTLTKIPILPEPGGKSTDIADSWLTYVSFKSVKITEKKSFRFHYSLDMAESSSPEALFGIRIWVNDDLKLEFYDYLAREYKGYVDIDLDIDDIFVYYYHHKDNVYPKSYEIVLSSIDDPKEFIDFHPTIDFSRYLPEWSVIDYINNLNDCFNLKIDIDDIAKTVNIDYNQNYLLSNTIEHIQGSFDISEVVNIPTESYILRHANDSNGYNKITKHGMEFRGVKEEDTKEIVTKFKIASYNKTTEFTKKIDDLEGIAIMLYDPSNAPNTIEFYNEVNLSIFHIYDYCWKKWILFLLNASSTSVKIALTSTELVAISKTKKIYANNQVFLIKKIKYKEDVSGFLETTMELLSVNY